MTRHEGLEHFAHARGLHLGGGFFLDAHAHEPREEDKERRDDQREILEAHDLAGVPFHAAEHLAQHRDDRHRRDCDDRAADARAGARQRGQILALLAALREGGDHAPVGDVHHRVGHAPENVEHCGVGRQPRAVELRRRGEHEIEDHGVRHRADQQPRAELAPAGLRLGDDDAHDRVVERVKHARGHEDDAHGDGAHAEQILKIIQNIARREHVHHVLADGAERIAQLRPPGQSFVGFHTLVLLLLKIDAAMSLGSPSGGAGSPKG